ncbi:MAG: NAD-dependent epimerase, partial [Bacteroidetes bacterium HGW-Bacteroidetes-12]
MENKYILVTGAAGFIGYHLTKKLLKNDFYVIGVDNLNDYYPVQLKKDRLFDCGIELNNNSSEILISNKYPKYHFIKGDIKDLSFIKQIFKDYDISYVCN